MTGKRQTEYPVGGWVLLVVGVYLLLLQLFPNSDILLLSLLGLGFVLGAIFTHKLGLLIPGGILSGIALGVYLIEPTRSTASEATEGGIFLMAFAAGWALITLLSPLVERWVWWPLIPAAILGFIGWVVWEQRLEWLEYLNWVWPLGLVGLGAWILLRPPGPKGQT